MPIKVAACQVPDVREDIGSALTWIEKFAQEAEDKGANIACFPECFLQGYLTDENLARKYAINLSSDYFNTILKNLAKFKPMLVFGLIEKKDEALFNTAVVVKDGQLVGKYQKTHLLDGERIFEIGNSYPIFEVNGIKFGINICYDTQFPEAAAEVAKQGATLILCPANNMMRRETAEKYKFLHHEIRAKRAVEAGVWMISADVTGIREGRIAYGPTSALTPNGDIIAQVPLMKTG
ncbi:MAG: carbon-nitrogen hydrolase family protein, partial [Acidobacteriota bacterium]